MNFLIIRVIKRKLFDLLNPSLQTFQYAFRVTAVTFVALMISQYSDIAHGGWIFVSAGFICSCFRGQTRSERFWLLLGTGCFYAFTAFVLTVLAQSVWLYIAYQCAAIILGVNFIGDSFDRKYVLLINLVFVAIIGSMPGTVDVAWQRTLDVALGFVVAFVLGYVVWPYRPTAIMRKLNDAIEQKNIYLLHWVLTEFACGSSVQNFSQQIHDDIMDYVQRCWQLLQIHPDEKEKKRLHDNMDLFGHIMLLSRLLFEPRQMNSLTVLYRPIEMLKSSFVRLTQQKFKIHAVGEQQFQQLVALLEDIENKHRDNEDMQSVCFVLNNLAQSIYQGKSDDTLAFS